MQSLVSWVRYGVRDEAIAIIGFLCAAAFAYGTILIVYRLFISPLAPFPGPRLAAMTGWYESYYDIWKEGKYVFEIEKMHQKYGPIVRLNPHELSINDHDFFNEVYVLESKRRTDKYKGNFRGMGLEGSHFLTLDHDLHRMRRKPLDSYFSRQGISRLQPMLAELAEKLAQRLKNLEGTNSIVNLEHAFFCYSQDVVGRVCWENEKDFLDDPEFCPYWYEMIINMTRAVPLMTGFPFIFRIVESLPERVLSWLSPTAGDFSNLESMVKQHIASVKQTRSENELEEKKGNGKISLFRYLLRSDLPASEMADDRLAREAKAMLGAGTVTPARMLSLISYYILAKPAIRTRLEEELRSVMAAFPDEVPSWADLERLPFLQAIIKEGLRLGWGGGLHRFPRCFPDEPIQYKNWAIPPNVPVGMSIYFSHSNPVVYPKPFEFLPERWLGDVDPAMHRHYVPFIRGSRNCTGINLALAEMNIALAAIFRPNGPKIELYETDESDVKVIHDFVVPLPKSDSNGMRILIR